jgi:hypothetical protein
MTINRFRKKPIVISAVQWTGENLTEVADFTGHRFRENGAEHWGEDDITAEVYDELHDTWVRVKTGQWILQGVKGEFYPCDPQVLNETYEEVVNG